MLSVDQVSMSNADCVYDLVHKFGCFRMFGWRLVQANRPFWDGLQRSRIHERVQKFLNNGVLMRWHSGRGHVRTHLDSFDYEQLTSCRQLAWRIVDQSRKVISLPFEAVDVESNNRFVLYLFQ